MYKDATLCSHIYHIHLKGANMPVLCSQQTTTIYTHSIYAHLSCPSVSPSTVTRTWWTPTIWRSASVQPWCLSQMDRILWHARHMSMRSSRPSSCTMSLSFPVNASWTAQCMKSAWRGETNTGEYWLVQEVDALAKHCAADTFELQYLHISSCFPFAPTATAPTVNQELLMRLTMELNHTPVMKVSTS